MIKRALIAITLILMISTATGCGSKIDYSLPDNPIEFNTSTFANPFNEADEYSAIEYKGREYIPFGTLKGSLGKDDIGECLGYLVQEGQKLESVRLFTLADDPEANYLVEIDTEGEMSQPSFYRAADTVGKEIDVPSFIDSLDYDYWR